MKEVLGEQHRRSSAGHLQVNKTLAKVRQWYNWLHTRENAKRWYHRDTVQQAKALEPKDGASYADMMLVLWWDHHKHHRTFSTQQGRKTETS